MKKLLLVILMLVSSLAQASTTTFRFEEGPTDTVYNSPYNTFWYTPVPTLSDSGITMRIQNLFSYSRSLDSLTKDEDYTCNIAGWNNMGTPESDPGTAVGLFRNAPSGSWALRFIPGAYVEGDYRPQMMFDPPIQYFGCWMSGVTYPNLWSCGYPFVIHFEGAPGTYNTHARAPGNPASLDDQWNFAPAITMGNDSTTFIHGLTKAYPRPVNGWEGCDTEYADGEPYHWDDTPLTPMCNWQWVEVTSSVPINTVSFSIPLGYSDAFLPLFIDDVRVSTSECPNSGCRLQPSQAHSDIAGAMILTGVNGEDEPGYSYSCTIRDTADNPVERSLVEFIFDPMGQDVSLYSDYSGPMQYMCGAGLYYGDHIARCYTDEEGIATFRLAGKVVSGSRCNFASAKMFVDGLQWTTKPVAAMDVNQATDDGIMVTAADYSAFLSIYYSDSTYCSRTDFNGNGTKDAGDLSAFLTHYFSGFTAEPPTTCTITAPQAIKAKPNIELMTQRVDEQSTVSTPTSKSPPAWSPRDGYYDVAGRRLENPPAHGIYWEVKKGLPRKVVVVK